MTARMKRRHDDDIAEGHTDTWAIREYKDRINPKGTKKANQRCGYCGEYGHTRRKCEKLQQDMDWYIMHHNVLVKVAHDYIVQSPVGIGSLKSSIVRRCAGKCAPTPPSTHTHSKSILQHAHALLSEGQCQPRP